MFPGCASGRGEGFRPRVRQRDEDDEDAPEVPREITSGITRALALDFARGRNESQSRELDPAPEPVQGDDDAAPSVSAPNKSQCAVCAEPAKYTCPKCHCRTCSLLCVRSHKSSSGCSGERDVAEKVPLANFTNAQLRRDYHFLEDTRRVLETARRGFAYDAFRFSFRALPPPLHALREGAKRHGVLCQIMSEGMSKRDRNTSRYDRRSDTITWRIEFRVHSALDTLDWRRQPIATEEPARCAASVPVLGTDWGSERARLSDVLANVLEVNPRLEELPIRRGYNVARRWVAAAGSGARNVLPSEEPAREVPDGAESEGSTSGLDHSGSEHEAHPECRSATADAPRLEGQPAESHEPVAPVDATEEEDATEEIVVAQLLHSRGVCSVGPEDLSLQQAILQRALSQPVAILSKAERLGEDVAYFKLDPTQSLHENLRQLFFIVEFPVLEVVPQTLLDAAPDFPFVTEEQKSVIRDTFRKKPKPPPKSSIADLAPGSQPLPCRNFARGTCVRADRCPFLHIEASAIPACRTLVKTGNCERGPRCSFSHDPGVVQKAVDEFRREQADLWSRKRGRPPGTYPTRPFHPPPPTPYPFPSA